MAQVLIVPLDTRPVNRIYPQKLAQLKQKETRVVPWYMLGNATRGADSTALQEWIGSQATNPEAMFVALDTLAYGGLVQSRNSAISAEQALEHLQILKTLPYPIYAHITIPRHPDAKHRERNLSVIRTMIDWAKTGVFKELRITWDDALRGSPAPKEAESLKPLLADHILLYPGADEAMGAMLARYLAPQPKRLKVIYTSPLKKKEVLRYDGLALEESVKLHAASVGFEIVDFQPEMTLLVYNGGNPRWQVLKLRQYPKPLVIADIESVNMGNAKFWKDMDTLGLYNEWIALAAWGTPGNNFGSVLAHAKLFLDDVDEKQQKALQAYEYTNDILYSTHWRAKLRSALPENRMNTPEAWQFLQQLSQNAAPLGFRIVRSGLPWGRSFEWEFELQAPE